MEGMSVFLTLICIAPFIAFIRKPWNFRKTVKLFLLVVISLICFWGASYVAVKSGVLSASKTGIRKSNARSYSAFIQYASGGVIGELNLDNLRFALHHIFRGELWKIPVWIILLAGCARLALTRFRLFVIVIIWIISGHAATKWLLTNFFRVVCDARHIQFTTPAWLIVFISGCGAIFAFANVVKKNPLLKRFLFFLGSAVCAVFLMHYILILGKDTIRFIRYDRIADWKQISALSKTIADKNKFIVDGGRTFELSYYKPETLYGNLNTCIAKLKSYDKVYYLAGKKKNEVSVLCLKNNDVVTIPYEPFSVFVIYKDKCVFSNYWRRVEYELKKALITAPEHTQILDGLKAARILLGESSISKNGKIIRGKEKINMPVESWKPLQGWGNIEKLGGHKFRWSSCKFSSLILPAYDGKIRKITLFGLPFFEEKNKSQEINAFLGNENLGKKNVAAGWQEISFDVPMGKRDGERRLTLIFGNPVVPSAINQGSDDRLLALGISNIKLSFMRKIKGNFLLTAASYSKTFLGNSWSNPEKWLDGKTFRWINGNTAEIFWAGSKFENAGIWEIEALPFAVQGKNQDMTVMQDDIILTNFVMKNSWTKYKINATSIKTGNCNLKFIFKYAIQPVSVGKGNDTRNLSTAISSIMYYRK